MVIQTIVAVLCLPIALLYIVLNALAEVVRMMGAGPMIAAEWCDIRIARVIRRLRRHYTLGPKP